MGQKGANKMKIYEKDGAVWAEHDGWTVCATDEAENNTLARKHGEEVWVAITDPDGKLVGCDFAIKDLRDLLNHAGFPHIEYFTTYHQTLRDLMGKPYGHAGEWHWLKNPPEEWPCIECGWGTESNWQRKTKDGYQNLCNDCFLKYFDNPPAPAVAEWSDDLIGATVEAIERGRAGNLCYRVGDQFVISSLSNKSYHLCRMVNQNGNFYLGSFTLVSKAPVEKRPIDPSEVDASWVGATVECVSDECEDFFTMGDRYVVAEVDIKEEEELPIRVICDDGFPLWVVCEYFTLVKKADRSNVIVEREEKTEDIWRKFCEGAQWQPRSQGEVKREIEETFDRLRKKADGTRWDETNNQDIRKDLKEAVDSMRPPKTRTECTHSALLEFPNGEHVTIPPPPESEGWEAETLLDETEWPHRYIHEYWMEHANRGPFIGHKEGQLIYDEYLCRYTPENPRIVSLTKWTREVEEPSAFEDAKNAVREFNAKVIPEVRKCLVESTWPQRHPPGAVKERKRDEESNHK
jgi:hypothetical protein